MSFMYLVLAEHDDAGTAAKWVSWLRDGHLAGVLAGGAVRAEVLQRSAPGELPVRLEVHYLFESAEAFARYERDFAPALRAEGLALFPPSPTLRLSRATAAVVASAP